MDCLSQNLLKLKSKFMSLNNRLRETRTREERKMFCQKCGSEVKQGQRVCPKCGKIVRMGIQIPTIKLGAYKNIVPIAVIVVVVLILFASVKAIGKSDEERIAGTWVLVEEVYGKPREYDIGTQIVFKEGGRFYDDEEFLRGHLDAGDTIVSWDILEDNHILIFTNEDREQCSAKYELNGKILKIISSENVYCILKKQ